MPKDRAVPTNHSFAVWTSACKRGNHLTYGTFRCSLIGVPSYTGYPAHLAKDPINPPWDVRSGVICSHRCLLHLVSPQDREDRISPCISLVRTGRRDIGPLEPRAECRSNPGTVKHFCC